jgi:hypothetical protein
MWMTSSFRAKHSPLVLGIMLIAVIAAGNRSEAQAPDAPRPARPQAPAPPSEDDTAYRGTVELKAVRIRRLDATLEKMAGPEFLKKAREPVAIEVQTARPLPTQPRNTSAVLIINGEKFMDTWMVQPDKLVAFVERGKLRDTNTAAAAWLGAEQSSTTRAPLTFWRGTVER